MTRLAVLALLAACSPQASPGGSAAAATAELARATELARADLGTGARLTRLTAGPELVVMVFAASTPRADGVCVLAYRAGADGTVVPFTHVMSKRCPGADEALPAPRCPPRQTARRFLGASPAPAADVAVIELVVDGDHTVWVGLRDGRRLADDC